MIPPNSLPSVREHLLSHLICSQFEGGSRFGFDPNIGVEDVRIRYAGYGVEDIDDLHKSLARGLKHALDLAISLIQRGAQDRFVLRFIKEELDSVVGPVKNIGGIAELLHLLAEIRYVTR